MLQTLKYIAFIFILIPSLVLAENLKIGDKVTKGYSKEVFECEVVEIYGHIIGFKTLGLDNNRVFYLLSNQNERVVSPNEQKLIRRDEDDIQDVEKDSYVEAQHPNGEWYVGKVVEKYGKFIKVQLGSPDWAAVWVPNKLFKRNLMIENDINFYDYRHRLIGSLLQGGIIKNRKGEEIGRVYSNGKVLDFSGEIIGQVKPDGTIDKKGVTFLKSNTEFKNGLELLDNDSKPVYVIRVKSASIYTSERPDIVHVFFDKEALKGNLRAVAATFFLMKEKF